MSETKFSKYGLSIDILQSIERLGFKEPTKVQEEVIPLALQEKDIIVKSKTGSGKTGAFAMPICEKISWEENKPQALVLSPTRELAMQIQEDFFHIGRLKRIKVVALYGKAPFMHQQKALKQKTHVVVGTPGRVIDHLEKGTWDTSEVKYLVIDEADEMLKMGFVEQIETIISFLSKDRVTMLFSATMPKDIEHLCHTIMKDPVQVEVVSKSLTTEQVEQIRLDVKEEEKIDVFEKLMTVENPDSCIIFCNTKIQVDNVQDNLQKRGIRSNKIHGGMEQRDREKVMEDFRKGYFRFLVATDVAARGIDINHITHVVNYDIPEDRESYVHRIGRTGRANRVGRAITFVTPRDSIYLKSIEAYIGKTIEKGVHPEEMLEDALKLAFEQKAVTRIEVEGKSTTTDIMKIHINAGKKTKMRPVDIVGTLCNIEGMTAKDIGIINVLDVSTFVEILNHKGEQVLAALQDRPIKGRVRRVTKADA